MDSRTNNHQISDDDDVDVLYRFQNTDFNNGSSATIKTDDWKNNFEEDSMQSKIKFFVLLLSITLTS